MDEKGKSDVQRAHLAVAFNVGKVIRTGVANGKASNVTPSLTTFRGNKLEKKCRGRANFQKKALEPMKVAHSFLEAQPNATHTHNTPTHRFLPAETQRGAHTH